jgi:hypothetical protein
MVLIAAVDWFVCDQWSWNVGRVRVWRIQDPCVESPIHEGIVHQLTVVLGDVLAHALTLAVRTGR